MLESHTRQIDIAAIKQAKRKEEKNNQEETKLKWHLGRTAIKILAGGGGGEGREGEGELLLV